MDREVDTFTGFGYRDDFSLLWLQPDVDAFPSAMTGLDEPWRLAHKPYLGPYPLFNTTLNLVGGSDLATQDRKGESFVLSPGYSGSKCTGWARFRVPKVEAHTPPRDGSQHPKVKDVDNAYVARNLTVGRAMTISGAAVDPNMQVFQSAGLTALLTLLNARLGWWIQNPWTASPNHPGARPDSPPKKWIAESPWSAKYLVWEALGQTRADTDYVHLSDGGHFENTGAYELIRRRCRFVILIDAAEDPLDASENLANLTRLVRTDFGIRIEIDTSPLHKDGDGLSRSHVAVGLIRYDDVDHGAVNGTLVFIRSSLTGDEPADLKNYATVNPPFPHHSTADQFFDEAQFESYRLLGHHVGTQVFGPAVAELDRQKNPKLKYGRRLFAELRQRWALLPNGLVDNYHTSVEAWLRLEEAMRSDTRVMRLTLDMYPELLRAVGGNGPTPEDVKRLALFNRGRGRTAAPLTIPNEVEDWVAQCGANRVNEIRVMAQLVQMMETAWMQMNLDETFAHPVQRGWMNCLRRYTSADAFQEYWPVLRPMYSAGFVLFCERMLNVAPLPVEAVRWDKIKPELQQEFCKILSSEFAREMAYVLDDTDGWERDYFDRVLKDVLEYKSEKNVGDRTITVTRPLAWVFRYGPPGKAATSDPEWECDIAGLPPFPLGVAFVRPWTVPTTCDGKEDGRESYELLFWVRGSHRTSDIGQTVLADVVNEINVAFKLPKLQSSDYRSLIVRFPKLPGAVAVGHQQAIWKTFFNDWDFAAYKLHPDTAAKEIRLRRWLPRTPPSGAEQRNGSPRPGREPGQEADVTGVS